MFALLRWLRTDGGRLPETLDRVLSTIAENRESGVLTALSGPAMKRVVFQDGRIAFAASNAPKDMIGQALVRSGLISEQDLVAAINAKDSLPGSGGKPQLAAALHRRARFKIGRQH